MLRRPLVPRFAFAVPFHERAEKRVIIEPGSFLHAEISKCGLIASPPGSPTLTGRPVHVARLRSAPLSVFARPFATICECLLEQAALHFLHAIVLHLSSAKSRQIDIGERRLKIFAR